MLVGELMTRPVRMLGPADTVRDALRMMSDLEIRHLPIVEDGELIGILSDRDLRPFLAQYVESLLEEQESRSPLDTPVRTLMQTSVVTVNEETPVRDAIDRLLEARVGALPVVVRGKRYLTGMLSYEDVLRAARPLLSPS